MGLGARTVNAGKLLGRLRISSGPFQCPDVTRRNLRGPRRFVYGRCSMPKRQVPRPPRYRLSKARRSPDRPRLGVPAACPRARRSKGKLVGLEKLMNPVWQEAKDVGSHRFSWREPSPTVRAEFRNLFAYAPKEVCVAALASSAQQPPALPLLITVGGGRTTPVTVVVAPGTRLHFENRDPFPHRTLRSRADRHFPPGEMAGDGGARLDGARPRQIRNPRRALAERPQLGRGRCERGRDRVSDARRACSSSRSFRRANTR